MNTQAVQHVLHSPDAPRYPRLFPTTTIKTQRPPQDPRQTHLLELQSQIHNFTTNSNSLIKSETGANAPNVQNSNLNLNNNSTQNHNASGNEFNALPKTQENNLNQLAQASQSKLSNQKTSRINW